MKKALKIIGLVVLLLGGIALATCYIVIPQETKSAIDIVMEYLNRPLPIAGISIITFSACVYGFLSSTSLGKKALATLKSEFSELRTQLTDKETMAKTYYELAIKEKEETKALLNTYKNELDTLTEELVKVCETIPNVKVKALAQEILSKKEQAQEQLETTIANLQTEIKDFAQERVDVKALQDRIAELEELVKGLVNTYGESKETINNGTEEE